MSGLWNAPTKARQAAMAKGVQFGRNPTIDRTQFAELVGAGTGASAKEMDISRSAVYKLKAEMNL